VRIHRVYITWGLVIALVPLLACGRSDSGGSWAGTIEPLPNGAVRVTNPAEALWGSQDSWQLTEELVLGETDGEGADVFASISGLEVDQAGNIYVLDRQANDLRIFDGEGTHIRSVGRAGQGPGEYSAANGLTWISGDTLLVVDQRGNRYSILSRNGEYVRSVRRALSFFGWVFNGGVDSDMVYEVFSVGREDDRRPVLLGTHLRGDDVESGILSASTQREAEAAPRFVADTLLLPRPDGPLYESFSIQTERGGMVMGVPFSGAPKYYLDGQGGVWWGHGGTPRLYHTMFQGDTLREVILSTEPVAVTAEEIADWESAPAIERFKTMGGKLDLSRIPKAKPYFDGIVLDPRGYIWLTVPGAPRQAIFTVLDPEGRYLGQLQVSGVARETFLRPVLRNGRLYFVGRDELDVQRIYVYRVSRAPKQHKPQAHDNR